MNKSDNLFTRGLPMRPEKAVAWHYTDQAGLLGILQSRKLWASAPLALNDTSEVKYGIGLLAEAWAKRQNDGPVPPIHSLMDDHLYGDGLAKQLRSQVFVASASNLPDLLGQWRSYAMSGGFAVGLNVHSLWGTIPIVEIHPTRGRTFIQHQVVSGWRDVIYNRELQVQLAGLVLDRLLEPLLDASLADDPVQVSLRFESNMMMMSEFVLLAKHPGFEDEREVRFIAGIDGQFDVMHRTRGGRLVPYIPVGVYALDETFTPIDASEKFPIEEVWFGPGAQRGMAELLRGLLDKHGFDQVPVRASQVPFSG